MSDHLRKRAPENILTGINICFYQCAYFLSSLEGVVEIWLTSEDTGAYGKDIGVTLPELLWQLVDVIPPGCMLRIGMTNPPYIQEYLEVSIWPLRKKVLD